MNTYFSLFLLTSSLFCLSACSNKKKVKAAYVQKETVEDNFVIAEQEQQNGDSIESDSKEHYIID